MARQGVARPGKAWRGKQMGEWHTPKFESWAPTHGTAWLGKPRRGGAWLGWAREFGRVTSRHRGASPRHPRTARPGGAWRGWAWRGEARQGEGSRWVNGMHSGSSPEHPRNKQVKGSRAGKHRDPFQPHTPRKKKLRDPPKQYSQLPSSATGGDAPLPSASQRPDR